MSAILTLRVQRIRRLTEEVSAFEFVHPQGRALPPYEPGAHLDVHLPGGFMRPYSLAAAPGAGEVRRYVIGVKREPASRGGSASLHARVREGDLLAVGTPRNGFALHAQAAHHLLLAGGIGLTPLLAMAQHLARTGASWRLAVFARSRAHLAFAEELQALRGMPAAAAAPGSVLLHLDDPAAPDKLDLATLLASRRAGEHLYLCGPAGFMQQALRAASAWPEETVHQEHFAAPEGAFDEAADEPFVLRLARRGLSVPVGAAQTAVQALHELGIEVPVSCEQGVCGTCVVGLLEGRAEHRDHCLSARERATRIALCCSRAKDGELVVEL